ncbi:MAG TPA: response regulator [Planctomycetota bacterium]
MRFQLDEHATVLILESDVIHGTLLKAVVEQAGGEALLAGTPEEALEHVDGVTPALILAAWDTDGLDGRTAVRDLRAQHAELRRVPAILMTDRNLTQLVCHQLRGENFRWILQKPIVVTSLPKLIERCCRDSQVRAEMPRLLSFGATTSSAYMAAV